jgi:hypothetical protein
MKIIIPHHGFGAVSFGMTRQEVAKALGREPKRGRRNQYDVSDYDYFENECFFAYYDAAERCCALEFTGESHILYDDYELFAHPALAVREWARQRDPDLESKDGFVSRALGLCMYAPLIDEPDLDDDEKQDPAQSFLVFRPGAYDEDRQRIEAVRSSE